MDIVRIPNFGINKFSYFSQFYYCGEKYVKMFGVINLYNVDELGVLVDDKSVYKRLIIPSDILDKIEFDFSSEQIICTDDEFKRIFFKRFGFELIDVVKPLILGAINNIHIRYEYIKSDGDKKSFNPIHCEYDTYKVNRTKLENDESILNIGIIVPHVEDQYIDIDLSKKVHDDTSKYVDKMFISEDMMRKLDKPENFQPSLF